MEVQRILCIYHANCLDGFAAAWIVRKYYGEENVEFLAANYGDPVPGVENRSVLIVDFSYPAESVVHMMEAGNIITIIDHHKSAIDKLAELKDSYWEREGYLRMVLDTNYSGAALTWQKFFPQTGPWLVLQAIADRDLWKFKLEGTREICSALASYPQDFKLWDDLIYKPADLYTEGVPIERYRKQVIADLLLGVHTIVVAGFPVPAVNAPVEFKGELGEILSADALFAVIYYDIGDTRHFSLRSNATYEWAQDVARIAEGYGGGGHKHAARFTAPHNLIKVEKK